MNYQLIRLISSMILGGIVVYIAYQQWLTAKAKLRFDLFEKRFKIYQDTLNFYQELLDGDPSEKTHRAFIVSKESAYHLFSEDRSIYELLDKMHEQSFKIIGFERHGKELDSSPKDKMKMAESSISTFSWFSASMPVLREKMNCYISQ